MSTVIAAHQAERSVVDPATIVTNHFHAVPERGASMVVIDLDGVHPLRVNVRSTKMVYVLYGMLTVLQDGGQTRVLAEGDAMHIPPMEAHGFEGNRTSFVMVCTPAFTASDERLRPASPAPTS